METKLFLQSVLSRRLHFSITQLQGVNFENFVQSQAKLQFENVCIDEGFVRPNSVKVITVSTGVLNKTKISFEVTFECEIFYPMNDAVIFCKAVSSTKAGIRAISASEDVSSPFVAFITREHNQNDKDYLKLEKNETFYASILASRYELNDKQVSIIGKFSRLAENTRKRKSQQQQSRKEKELIEESDKDKEEIQESDEEKVENEKVQSDNVQKESDKVQSDKVQTDKVQNDKVQNEKVQNVKVQNVKVQNESDKENKKMKIKVKKSSSKPIVEQKAKKSKVQKQNKLEKKE